MQTGGVSGGRLLVDSTLLGANAQFNRKLVVGSSVSTISVMFKYNSALYTGEDHDAASIVIQDTAGGNAIFFETGNVGAEMKTGSSSSGSSWASAFFGGWLHSGNWYILLAKVNVDASNHIIGSAQVFECGPTGTSTPSMIASRSNDDLGTGLPSKTVNITIGSNRRAGSETVDNFNVSGQLSTGITQEQLQNAIVLPTYVVNSKLHVASSLKDQISYCLYDMNGRSIAKGNFQGATDIDCSELPAGNYLICFLDAGAILTRKIVRQ